MEALARLAARRPVAITVLAIGVAVLGVLAWNAMPLDLLPDVQSPTVVVSVRSGDRPPLEMERVYGERVEQQLFTVRGIRSIDQTARTGRLIATVTFDWGADMDIALVDVEKAVGSLRSDPDVEEVVVRRFDPRQTPVLSLGLVSDESADLAELRRIAKRQIAVALERLDGVAEVRVLGGREREVRVEVDRYRAESHGIPLSELESRIRSANADIDAGTLEEGSKVYLVRGISRFRRATDIANVVVRHVRDASGTAVPVRVSDIAEIREADAEVRHVVTVDGVEGVGLSIYKEAGANTVAVSRVVREALSELEGDLPGIEVRVVADESALVEDALADVRQAALIGIGLAVAVLVLFLRSVGPTVVVAAAVPVSLLGALFLMHLRGHSLNIMTLGGLALGAGMLVDNAIVVVESVFRRIAAGDGPEDAAGRGTGEVAGAIAASTLTTCAVFLPVIFVQGLAARLVTGLAFAVVASLLVSLGVATLLIPALARWLLPVRRAKAVDVGSARVERFVRGLLRRPWLVVAVSVFVAALAVVGLTRLGTELLPPTDPRQFSVRVVGPPGQRVEATARAAGAVEEAIRAAADGRLEAVLAEVGRLPEDDRLIRDEQTEENTARLRVRIADDGPGASWISERASRAIEAPGTELSWEVAGSALATALGTTGPPVQIEVYGRSLDDLRYASELVVAGLAEEPSVWNVRSSFEGGPPELRVHLDRGIADGLGVDLDVVAATLEASLDGRVVTKLSLGDEERDVALRLPEARIDELARIPVTTASGTRVAIGDVVRFENREGAREIFRSDQRRLARVTARIAPGYEFPEAIAAARAVAERIDRDSPGLRLAVAGEEEERARAFGELRWAALLALLLVFMVLAGTFESLIHPITVALAVPLAWIGVAAVLLGPGRPIGVMEMLGVIVLSGVAVNDAILLIDAARRFMRDGVSRVDALARAAALRLRPIMMTTATTVLALVPLAIGTGEAARLRSPLALTIVGGIVASTFASLFVIPAIYLVLDRFRPGSRRGAA